MPIQYTTPAVQGANTPQGIYPTNYDTRQPDITFTQPTQTTITTRNVTFAWAVDKPSQFKWALQGPNGFLVPWTTTWSVEASASEYTHTNIPNGSYTFFVKAMDRYGNEKTESFAIEVRREILAPTQIAPLAGTYLPNASVVFRCNVPLGEIGDLYDYEIQILKVVRVNPLQTERLDPAIEWYSSADSYSGWSFTAPIPENIGGEVSFTKILDLRKRYQWRVRLRVTRGGVTLYGPASPYIMFTTGILGTQLVIDANPTSVRADGVNAITLLASARDIHGNTDNQWTGTVNFSSTGIPVTFVATQTSVPFIGGIATTRITSTTVGNVTIKGVSTSLLDGEKAVGFIANRLPFAPEWATAPFNPPEVSLTSAELVATVPIDLDNDRLHFKMEIDEWQTFDGPNLIISESRFETERGKWQYFNGTEWVSFPAEGVPQGVPGTLVKYVTGEVLQDGKTYYCRIAAWDQFAL